MIKSKLHEHFLLAMKFKNTYSLYTFIHYFLGYLFGVMIIFHPH